MGLDMYAVSVHKANVTSDWKYKSPGYNNDNDLIEDAEEFQYWRKNRHLHNWMEQLYNEKVPADVRADLEVFNGIPLRLYKEDLFRLQQDILDGKVAKLDSPGFFFGNTEYEKDYAETDLQFVAKALVEIMKDSAVYYKSSW